jgi:hybrid polyketide synthase/nonribosomal peptide synthetase ACE1
MQIEDLTLKAIVPATAADDRAIYTSVRLGHAAPDGAVVTRGVHPTVHEAELALACERLAYYYIRKWDDELEDKEWETGPTHHTNLRAWVKRTLSAISRGKHAHIRKEWVTDGPEDVEALASRFSDEIDFRICSTVGENLVSAVRSQTPLSEQALGNDQNNILDSSFGHELDVGRRRYHQLTATIAKQISHRYPLAKVFEIGQPLISPKTAFGRF